MSERVLRSFVPRTEWDKDCETVVAIWSDEPTLSEIAAAHPKCETCGHCEIVPRGHGLCTNGAHLTGYPLIDGPKVKPATDYCPHHTELTEEQSSIEKGAPDGSK